MDFAPGIKEPLHATVVPCVWLRVTV